MSDYAFQTDNLCVGYDGQALIRDISLQIRSGEIITLIGPNGSGKSTILKSITRQLKLIGGSVRVIDRDLQEMKDAELARTMAVVLTERLRPELMSCWDVVATGRYPYTGRLGLLGAEDRRQICAAMEAVHALDLRERSFNAISDGQRQRVLLARAICQQPEIIVLDEPTSFLDIRHKLELLNILRAMAREKGITVIMSLHEIDLAEKISDKILCVNGGTISHFGPPEAVFEEGIIGALYGIQEGGFDPAFGSIELPRTQGVPKVFVISGCGSGIPVYRKLQREGIPFCAGILYANDVDYHLARQLAHEVVMERPFQRITDATMERALMWVQRCAYTVNAGVEIGETNQRMLELLRCAESLGKLR